MHLFRYPDGCIQTDLMENEQHLQQRKQYLASLQLMFTVTLALGMLLAFQFAKRIADSRPLHKEYEQTRAEVNELEIERSQLRDELAFIQSDDFVEIWARTEARMLLPGDVFVFPIYPETEAITESPPVSETTQNERVKSVPKVIDEASSNWQLWKQLFFDDP